MFFYAMDTSRYCLRGNSVNLSLRKPNTDYMKKQVSSFLELNYGIACQFNWNRVWHDGLLYKLKQLGIDGTLFKWFKRYLSEIKQRVVIEGAYSFWKEIQAGVPQGSVLGPLLFLIYLDSRCFFFICWRYSSIGWSFFTWRNCK